MSPARTEQAKWRHIYERIAPMLVVVCLLASFAASVGTFAISQSQEADRQARADDQARLLMCFDDYAAASSASTIAVREASTVRDAATRARDAAFTALFEFIATDPGEGSAEGLRLFNALTVANADLVQAQIALAEAREDNPVPDPPSKLCGD